MFVPHIKIYRIVSMGQPFSADHEAAVAHSYALLGAGFLMLHCMEASLNCHSHVVDVCVFFVFYESRISGKRPPTIDDCIGDDIRTDASAKRPRDSS